MTQKTKEFFDRLYKDCQNRTPDPSVAVSSSIDDLKPGTVLDLGAGNGRDSIYLAKQGFDVTSVDISAEGLALLEDTAKQKGVGGRIQTVEADVANYQPDKEYDNVICIFTLHFLDESNFRPAIDRIMGCTKSGGLNVLSDLTTNGPLYSIDSTGHWVQAGEFKEIYESAGWEILDNFTYSSSTMMKDAEGKPFQHESDHLIVRKH